MQVSSARGRNKAADLKKLIQLACNSQKTETTEITAPFTSRDKARDKENSECLKSNMGVKTSQSNSLINQLKELNTKKGLTTVSLKNKENLCVNKVQSRPDTKLTSSVSFKSVGNNSITTKSLKHIKISPISTSIEIPKIAKTISSTTNRNMKSFKYESTYETVRVPPATSRERSPMTGLKRPAGFKITDFNLGKKLGKGRFGHVRLAQDKATKFALAIKTINIQQLKESQMQAQLIEQIKLQVYCNHPNILKMYGFFNDNKNIYLLLQLGNFCLFQQLRTEKQYAQERTAYYFKQVIEGLKYVHSQSIIHRDIKPENILVTEGVLKLSDFGWSTYSPLLKRQTFCGTLDYVSPQVVNGEYYDQKVDIWSLGVLLYELSVGKAPFEDPQNNQEATYDKILSSDISFPEDMSDQLRDLISKILPKNPNQRLSISQIQNHPWIQKYKTIGRFISKQVWDSWLSLKSEE